MVLRSGDFLQFISTCLHVNSHHQRAFVRFEICVCDYHWAVRCSHEKQFRFRRRKHSKNRLQEVWIVAGDVVFLGGGLSVGMGVMRLALVRLG